jgi:hypothetical protein
MISATNVAAPAILIPLIRAPASMFRRAAHWVHTVTEPAARIPASRSARGAACLYLAVRVFAAGGRPGDKHGDPS